MFKGQREILKLHFVLSKLRRIDADFPFYLWSERGIPPEDMDKVFITLGVLAEELGKIKDQCNEALDLIEDLKSQC